MPRGGYKRTEETRKSLSKARLGKPPWNKGSRGIMKAWNKGSKLTKEHKEKLRKAKLMKPTKYWLGKKRDTPWMNDIKRYKGAEHYKWKVDRSSLKKSEHKHQDSQYRVWMTEVKKRDGWKCKINNSDCNGRLESHHILNWKDYPELRYEINNGITLCHAHHPRKRSEEAKLSPFFNSLVAEMK